MALTLGVNGRTNGREPASVTGGAWRLLSFTVFLFALVLVSYLGLEFGYRNFLRARIADREAALAALAEQVSKGDQDTFLRFQFELENLSSLLKNHVLSSKLFPLLEANTNARVSLRSLDLSVEERRLILEGTAESYQVVAEQLEAFDRLKEVERYELGPVTPAEKGRVNWSATLFVAASALR
jgi:hypothetical protein